MTDKIKLSRSKFGAGVKWHDVNQRWEARIMVNGKRTTLGYYKDVEEAERVYANAKKATENESLNFLMD